MFTTDLNLIEVNGAPDLWWFGAPLVWDEPGMRITVPVGFITDLASIPHALDWIPFLDRTGNSRRPAALHDALYALGRVHGKDFADAMLRVALQSEGLSRAQAGIYYQAVHLFGDASYASDATAAGDIDPWKFVSPALYAAWKLKGSSLFG